MSCVALASCLRSRRDLALSARPYDWECNRRKVAACARWASDTGSASIVISPILPPTRTGFPQVSTICIRQPCESLRRGVPYSLAMTSHSEFELNEVTLLGLRQAMETGDQTARSITQLYLDRIALLNVEGPELRAIIETNPDVLEIADELDLERQASGPRGPLHGVPVVLKDNIDTADGLTTTAGSLALEGSTPDADAFIVERLRAAGYPNISVPMGDVRGLPVGISFFGRAWSESTLLRIAYAYEQATCHRTQPSFVATLG